MLRYIGENMTTAAVAAHIEEHRRGWSGRLGEVLRLGVEPRDEACLIGEAV